MANETGNVVEEHNLIYQTVLDTLKTCAPGLDLKIKSGIAISVALKLRSKIDIKPEFKIKEI